jgi:hypothetical protein
MASIVHLEDCEVVGETDKAIFVAIGDGIKSGERMWIPKSQVHDDSEIWKLGQEGTLVITEWIAEQKGLI